MLPRLVSVELGQSSHFSFAGEKVYLAEATGVHHYIQLTLTF